MPAFEFDHVTVSIRKNTILNQVRFSLESGGITALIGHNGAGKSTIMKAILGLVPIEQGSIQLAGVNQADDGLAFKSNLSYIPEEPFLLSELTVQQHFQLYAESYQIDGQDAERLIDYYTQALEISDKCDDYPESLSKGMRQKVQTICALLPKVKLILVDEPFMGLDIYASDFLMKELKRKAQEEGAMVLLTTHQLDRLTNLTDHYIMLQQGKIIDQGKMEDFSYLKRRFEES
ncbi:ABC transporter ATP-binding protein [Amphibacillus jilinensis]|uniref:ABC transporter ATP-binding protein n=1 Tax=Amphibacillus jilinensis TaxID=1216008 RepID=UPI00030B6EC9|nr:ABC transporter ATP-binding protein [Amphibacillus jilinensis]